jgi:hypothetical protein
MSVSPSVWDLVRAGDYHSALVSFEERCAQDPSAPNFYNLGTVRLLSGECEGALSAFSSALAAIEPRYRGGIHFIMQAVCHWYLNRPSATIGALHHALDAPYTDAAGGWKHRP